MPLSRIEIRRRATAFAKEFADAHNEDGQAKTFWHEFFGVFGLKSNRIGSFELHVKKLNKADGYVDFFWPGMLWVGPKSMRMDVMSYYCPRPSRATLKWFSTCSSCMRSTRVGCWRWRKRSRDNADANCYIRNWQPLPLLKSNV